MSGVGEKAGVGEWSASLFAAVLFVALGVALLGASPARAQVPSYFVTQGGNDNWECSQANPCRSIVQAINVAEIDHGSRSNAEIWIGPGEYAGNFGVNTNVQLRGEGADKVRILKGAGSRGIQIFSQDDGGSTTVTMSGLTIQSEPRPEGYTGSWSNRGIKIEQHAGGAGQRLTLENVVVKDFDWFEDGGGIYSHGGHLTLKDTVVENNSSTGRGGGIFALGGSVSVQDSVVRGNRAGGSGGGITADQASLSVSGSRIGNNRGVGLGGGINAGSVSLADSAVGGNTVENGSGGGVYAPQGLTASNSSFVGNEATGQGGSGSGGGFLASSATLTNVTVAGNSAASSGGGFWANGDTNVTNTLIAGNSAPRGPDCWATLSTTNGHNMIGNNSGCGGLTDYQNGNRVGTPLSPIDPRLYELDIDGMPVAMELLNGSPANSAGHAETCIAAPVNDRSQLGVPRNTAARGDKCDIGAFDYGEEIPPGLPDAPTDVSGGPGNDGIDLTWTPGYDGGSGINGYAITCSPACPQGTTGLATQTGEPRTTIRGLNPGTSYTFRVASKNVVGTGPYSEPSAGILFVTAPGAPTNVRATGGSGSADLTWTAPPNNGAEITSYRITCNPYCEPGGSPVTGNPAPTSATLTGLARNTTYTFQVRAANSAGVGPASEPSNAVLTNAAPVVRDQSSALDEDGTRLITLVATDADDDPLAYKVTGLPQNGALYRGDSTAEADRIADAGATLGGDRLTYKPNPDYNGPDSFGFLANDGKVDGDAAIVSLTVAPVNDRPVLDLDGAAEGATFTEGGEPVPVTDPDTLAITDVDDETIERATVYITNRNDGAAEKLAVSPHPGITQSHDAPGSASLTLDGPASKEAYQRLLGTLTYENTSQNPDTTDRALVFAVYDGESDSDPATTTIRVVAVNDPPVVDLSGDADAGEGETRTYAYTLTDPDGPDSAVVEGCGANGVKTDTPEQNSFRCTFPDGPATSAVGVAADDGRASGEDSVEVRVSNVAPAISLSGPGSADEGDTKAYAYTITDPGEDDHTTTTSCGANGAKVEGSDSYDPETREGGFACRFPNGPSTTEVAAKATDSDGDPDSDDRMVAVAVANVVPTVNLSGGSRASEGDVKTYTYTVSDPGDPDPEITESCGAKGKKVDTPKRGSFRCVFSDGPTTSSVSVSVSDGDAIARDGIEVRTSNVAPRLTLRGQGKAREGQTHTYRFSVDDPGQDAFSFPRGYPTCGKGSKLVGRNTGNSGGSFRCTFGDGPSKAMVALKVQDSDGSVSRIERVRVKVVD